MAAVVDTAVAAVELTEKENNDAPAMQPQQLLCQAVVLSRSPIVPSPDIEDEVQWEKQYGVKEPCPPMAAPFETRIRLSIEHLYALQALQKSQTTAAGDVTQRPCRFALPPLCDASRQTPIISVATSLWQVAHFLKLTSDEDILFAENIFFHSLREGPRLTTHWSRKAYRFGSLLDVWYYWSACFFLVHVYVDDHPREPPLGTDTPMKLIREIKDHIFLWLDCSVPRPTTVCIDDDDNSDAQRNTTCCCSQVIGGVPVDASCPLGADGVAPPKQRVAGCSEK